MLVQSQPHKGFNHGLTANVQISRSLIEFGKHLGGKIHIDPLNGGRHFASICEVAGNIFTGISQFGDAFSGGFFGDLRVFRI